jgi:hypothetical protein
MGDGGLGTGLACELAYGGSPCASRGWAPSLRGECPPDVGSPDFGHELTVSHPGSDTCEVNRRVELLTREGCTICAGAATRLAKLADELGFELTVTDVDAVASAGDSALRAEFGDRLPVVLLDGAEHSYWEVDEPRLRADLARG